MRNGHVVRHVTWARVFTHAHKHVGVSVSRGRDDKMSGNGQKLISG